MSTIPEAESLTTESTMSTSSRRLGRLRIAASRDNLMTYAIVVILLWLVLLPMGFLLYATFRTDSPGMPGATFTLENWQQITESRSLQIIYNTVKLGLATTLGATLLGVFMAWLVARSDMPGRDVLETVLVLPLLISPLLTALAWIALAGPNAGFINVLATKYFGIERPIFDIYSLTGMIFVLVLHFAPFIYLVTVAAFKSIDPNLEDASRMSGAGVLTTMRRVVIPVLSPAVFSGALIVLVLASEQFAVPVLLGLGAKYNTVQREVYSSLISFPSNPPYAATLALVLTLLTFVWLLVYQRVTRASRRFVTITGKGFRPRITSLGRWRWAALAFCLVYLALAVVLPYLALFGGSLLLFVNPDISLSSFTFDNYHELFSRGDTTRGIRNTLTYGIVGAVVIVLFSSVITMLTVRSRARSSRLLEFIATAPLTIPSLALAIGILWTYLYIKVGVYGTIWILVIAYTTRYTATAMRILSPAMLQVDPELEESARVHGGTRMRTLFRITLPILRPALISAWVLIFVHVILDVSLTLFLANAQTETLAVQLWKQQAGGFSTLAYAIAILLAAIGLIVIAVGNRIGGSMAHTSHGGS